MSFICSFAEHEETCTLMTFFYTRAVNSLLAYYNVVRYSANKYLLRASSIRETST